MMVFEVGYFFQQRLRVLFAKDLFKHCSGPAIAGSAAGFSTVICRGKSGFLEFMRQTAGQFAPGGHPFGLEQALFLEW